MTRPPEPQPANDHEDYAKDLLRACGLTTQCVASPLGPESTFPALDWARSGAMHLTGERDEAPRFAAGPLATVASGLGAALTGLAPTSNFDALDAAALLGERAAIAGLERAGRVSPGGSARLLKSLDGWLAINLPRAEDWSLVPAWLEQNDAPHAFGEWDALAARLARARSPGLLERGRLLGLAISAASPHSRVPTVPFRLRHATDEAPNSQRRRIRLLDLSNLWAGPLAASLLAQAGVDVLKIESPERPDGARRGDKAFFDLMNGNKRTCALDLQQATDRCRFERLLDSADVVLESSRPRAMEQLGYDAADWTSAGKGRLWVSITGYGRATPQRDWVAFGDDAAVAAGLAFPLSPGQSIDAQLDPPYFCADAIADPLTGLHAAVISLAHLCAGRGGVLDISLVETCRHASNHDAGPLVLPIETQTQTSKGVAEQGFFVRDESTGERVPVERPRARTAVRAAAELASPSDALLSSWCDAC